MDNFISNCSNIQSVPEDYIFPPESRPSNLTIPFSNTIPVIDLSEETHNSSDDDDHRTNTIQNIIKASKEFGFFQVINHGISVNLMNETRSVMKEVFEMPAEYKQKLYSNDPLRKCRMVTSGMLYAAEKVHLWRDILSHPCHPLEQWQHLWPEYPTRYRECVGACSVEVRELAIRILNLISEGIGLECGFFDNDLTGMMTVGVNHYPPCPEPSLTLGVTKHSDPNIITILLQHDVSGLQVFKDGDWIAVQPIPNAFVVNIGYMLQVISNGMFKSAEHRAVTNSSVSRTSAAFFLSPLLDCVIEPAQSLTDDEHNPPLFRPFKFKEFVSHYLHKHGDTDLALKPFEAPFVEGN